MIQMKREGDMGRGEVAKSETQNII